MKIFKGIGTFVILLCAAAIIASLTRSIAGTVGLFVTVLSLVLLIGLFLIKMFRRLPPNDVRVFRVLATVVISAASLWGLLVTIFPPGITMWMPAHVPQSATAYANQPTRQKLRWSPQYGSSMLLYGEEYQRGGSVSMLEIAWRPGLTAEDCPTVYSNDRLLPQGCNKIGQIQNSPVYLISPRLPSMSEEAHVRLGATYVVVNFNFGPRDAEVMAYMRTLHAVSHREASNQLATARREATTVHQAETQYNLALKVAYRHLSFSPVLPATVPDGWSPNYGLRGTDPRNPSMLDVTYAHNKYNAIFLYVVPMDGFSLQPGKCGPLTSLDQKDDGYTNCHMVYGKDYYMSSYPSNSTGLIYYRPIGNAVAVGALFYGDDTVGESYQHGAAALAQIINSLQVVDLSVIKNAYVWE